MLSIIEIYLFVWLVWLINFWYYWYSQQEIGDEIIRG